MTDTELPSPVPDRHGIRFAVGLLIAAVGVPWLVLAWGGYRQFDSWAAAAAPFGFGRVALVHLLTGLPFAIWVAWHGPRGAATNGRSVGYAVAVGAIVSIGFAVALGGLATWCNTLTSGQRFTARLSIAFLLQLPWCWGAIRCAVPNQTTAVRPPFDWATALLFIMMVPWIYRNDVISRQSELVADAIANDRHFEAWQTVRKLASMGTDQDTESLTRGLSESIASARAGSANELPPDADAESRLLRAQSLHLLSQFEQAKQTLEPLADTDPRAMYRIAWAAEMQGDWRESADTYQRVLDRITQLGGTDENARSLARSAIERSVNNLRRLGDYEQAEALLVKSLEAWPEDQASTQLQLGLHYQMIGRVNRANLAFDEAVVLNPKYQEKVDDVRDRLKLQMEGCLLGPRGRTP